MATRLGMCLSTPLGDFRPQAPWNLDHYSHKNPAVPLTFISLLLSDILYLYNKKNWHLFFNKLCNVVGISSYTAKFLVLFIHYVEFYVDSQL